MHPPHGWVSAYPHFEIDNHFQFGHTARWATVGRSDVFSLKGFISASVIHHHSTRRFRVLSAGRGDSFLPAQVASAATGSGRLLGDRRRARNQRRGPFTAPSKAKAPTPGGLGLSFAYRRLGSWQSNVSSRPGRRGGALCWP